MEKNLFILPDGTELSSGIDKRDSLRSVTFTEWVNTGTELTIGSTCAACVEATIISVDGDLTIRHGTELTYYKVLDDGTRTAVGLFTCEEPKKTTAHLYKFTAYDRVTRLDKDLTAWIRSLKGWPYTVFTFAQMVCAECNLQLANVSLRNGDYQIQAFSAEVTGRMLMKWLGQICASFCRATADGRIEFAWYKPNNATIQPTGENYFLSGGLSYADYQVAPIDKVQIRNGSEDVGVIHPAAAAGTNTYVIDSNPLLCASSDDALRPVAEEIYTALQGLTYTPCKVSIRANLLFRAGDILQIADRNGNTITTYIMTRTQSGQKVTLESTGSSSRNSVTAANSQSFEKLMGKVLNISTTVDGIRVENKLRDEKQASLEMEVDEIALEVSTQKEKVDNLQVGARNLIRNSETLIFDDYNFSKSATYPLWDVGRFDEMIWGE